MDMYEYMEDDIYRFGWKLCEAQLNRESMNCDLAIMLEA